MRRIAVDDGHPAITPERFPPPNAENTHTAATLGAMDQNNATRWTNLAASLLIILAGGTVYAFGAYCVL